MGLGDIGLLGQRPSVCQPHPEGPENPKGVAIVRSFLKGFGLWSVDCREYNDIVSPSPNTSHSLSTSTDHDGSRRGDGGI